MDFKNLNFNTYKAILENHWQNENNLFTEDLIRYWFIEFFRTQDSGKNTTNTQIEVPYERKITPITIKPSTPIKLTQPINKNGVKGYSRRRVDLYYADNDEVIEFKFHRNTLYSKCCTGTDLGSLINDFNRLSILNNKKKYSIYVFDDTMKNYFGKKTNAFPFIDFNNFTNSFNITNINKNLVNIKGFGEILKNAFDSFDTNNYDLSRLNYNIKLIFKAAIQRNKTNNKNSNLSKNLYIMIFEIE